jgi:hypothetical protein
MSLMPKTFLEVEAPLEVKLDNFPKYVRRQRLSRFLARYELFKLQMGVKGSIIECGVQHGGGLLAWAKLSEALEPYAIHRRVFGFDTFNGFPRLHDHDVAGSLTVHHKPGGFHAGYDVYTELGHVIEEFDEERYLRQFQKVFLVRGDAQSTIPAFVREHPYVLVSLLFMDFDLYEPTRIALETFVPRMSKGSILAFDEVNNDCWPGATQALLETVDLRKHTINKFSMDPNIAYIVL